MRLGFIGLGSMGAPMAMRLAAWPGGLVVHDLREEVTEPLAAVGATVAGCVGDVAAADVIGVAVLDDSQVRAVVAELARHAGPGTVIAIHSTIGDTTPPPNWRPGIPGTGSTSSTHRSVAVPPPPRSKVSSPLWWCIPRGVRAG